MCTVWCGVRVQRAAELEVARCDVDAVGSGAGLPISLMCMLKLST